MSNIIFELYKSISHQNKEKENENCLSKNEHSKNVVIALV